MGQRILVVDDEEGIVLLLKDYFELQGYEVVTAGGGVEALDKICCDPDMILLDINMPDLDGLSVCREIREKVDCPILFLTARVEEQDRITGLMTGGDDYITKPFSIEELGARVMAHLRREERGRHSGAEAVMYLLSVRERAELQFLQIFSNAAPWILTGCGAVWAALLFYRKRLKRPCEILKKGVAEMGRKNLDFAIAYDSRDEMGELCRTFEQMRKEVIADREDLWRRIEDQKEINAAFAHDMRTPLTVLRGYTELLYRYAPEGRISEEKLLFTLKLMSENLKRLEEYTKTMRQIRSFEELEPQKGKTTVEQLRLRITEIAEALNAVGDIRIRRGDGNAPGGKRLPEEQASDTVSPSGTQEIFWLDESLFLEVLENLLSNALRYAKNQVEISLDYEEESRMLFLYVHDDGPGFDERELKSATEPYFRGTGQTSGEEEGHFGIGLHICRVAAGKHGGGLNVANGMDGGAFVSVSFFCGKS